MFSNFLFEAFGLGFIALSTFLPASTECASKVSKTGDVMTGNLLLNADGHFDRVLDCTNINLQRIFSLPLGSTTNQISFTYSRNGPVVMDTDYGCLIKTRETDIRHALV